MNWLLRQRSASLADMVAHTKASPEVVEAMVDQLTDQGFVVCDQTTKPAVFKPNLVARKSRTVPDRLWQALE
jgi:uncharacterized membrane protein affecting hemolysin expression